MVDLSNGQVAERAIRVMPGAANAHDELLQTSETCMSSAWDQLLKVQTDLFLPFELDFFYSCQDWIDAKRVLDVGCGNGYYLSKLHDFFPDKHYVGLDVSPELIALATQDHAGRNKDFICSDLFAFEGQEKFDVIILRLVVQHLSGLAPVLQRMCDLTHTSSSILLIEPDVEKHINVPKTPLFEEFLDDIRSFSQSKNGNRADLSQLGTLVRNVGDWTLQDDVRVSVPFTGPFAGTDYFQMFLLWTQIWEQSGTLIRDFEALRNELFSWSKSKSCFSRIGVQFLNLQRVQPN